MIQWYKRGEEEVANETTKPKTIKDTFCKDLWGNPGVKVQAQWGAYEIIPWDYDTVLRPGAHELVDALLAGIGIGTEGTEEDLKCWATVRDYCFRYISDMATDCVPGVVTVGQLEPEAIAFWEGYQAGLKEQFRGKANRVIY